MTHIFLKEFNGFLNSLMGYMVVIVFLMAMGLLMWVFPVTSVLDYGYADMDTLFSYGPYVFIFLVPAITMKSFAEERKLGTLELLLTKPLTISAIVGGKFIACFFLVALSVFPTIVYYFTLYTLGSPQGNIDTPGVVGSFVGLILLGGVFCAIGIFASSITSNQIISFIGAAFSCFILYSGFDSAATLISDGGISLQMKQWGIMYHYESLSKGVIDSRDLIYFLSVAGMLLLSTKTILSSRSW